MRSNRALHLLASAAILWPVAANATITTFIGSGAANSGTTTSAATTAAVPSGGKLFIASFTANAVTSVTGMTGCTADANVGTGNYSSTATSVRSWTCASGLASGTTITLNWTASGEGAFTMLSAPSTVTTQDKFGGNSGTGTAATFTTAALSQASEVMIEISTTVAGVSTETPPGICTLVRYDGAASSSTFTNECLMSSTSAYSYSGAWNNNFNWAAAYSTYLYAPGGGAVSGSRSLLGVGQ